LPGELVRDGEAADRRRGALAANADSHPPEHSVAPKQNETAARQVENEFDGAPADPEERFVSSQPRRRFGSALVVTPSQRPRRVTTPNVCGKPNSVSAGPLRAAFDRLLRPAIRANIGGSNRTRRNPSEQLLKRLGTRQGWARGGPQSPRAHRAPRGISRCRRFWRCP
jgi:hypothetical protein